MSIINKCVHMELFSSLRPLPLAPINSEIHRILSKTSLNLITPSAECLSRNMSKRLKYPNLDIKWKWPHVTKRVGTLGSRRCRPKGIFREDGEFVSAGTILVKQLGLLYFPGLNVGLGRNRNLFAMEHGRVMITTEQVNPNWNQKILHLLYGQYAGTDTPIFKTYFHVITTPMPQTFKLTHQI